MGWEGDNEIRFGHVGIGGVEIIKRVEMPHPP